MTTQVQTEMTVKRENRVTMLTKVLRADGLFALLSGIVLIIGAGTLASLFEFNRPAIFAAVGAVLLGYAAMLLYFAGRESQNRMIAQIAIVLNLIWVIGSYAGLILGWFPVNTAGKWAIALAAEAVAIFAILEFIALRRIKKEVVD